jgi:2-hydroxy-6-oxonona-2,4-dienedioate hydrolase
MMVAPGAVLDFLDGLGLGTLPIVGNSMGGAIAARIAADHPDRVSRLMAIGGVGLSLLSPSPPEGIKLLVEFVEDPTRERLVTRVHDARPQGVTGARKRGRAAGPPSLSLSGVQRRTQP